MEVNAETLPKKKEERGKMEVEELDLVQPVYKKGIYKNPWDTWSDPEFGKLLKFSMNNFKEFFGSNRYTKEEYDELIPVLKPDNALLANPDPSDVQVTWIGHASALVQMEGVNFLTDPVWCERVSPLSFMGPKRIRPVPIQLGDLPPISFVVISHNHYDHLDIGVVKQLGNSTLWIVPAGLKSWFEKNGVTNVVELGWWESHQFNDQIEIVSTPCQHWSKRTAFDTNASLWSSWSILGREKRVYFSGDTGYCSVFETIGKKYGPFDVSLIAIGAYCPRDFLKAQHVDPPEAVQIHLDIQSKKSIGIHWGTFILSSEKEDDPPKYLAKILEERQLDPNSFIVTNIGQVWSANEDAKKDAKADPKEDPQEEPKEDSKEVAEDSE